MSRRDAFRGISGQALTILGLWAVAAMGAPAQQPVNPPPRQGGDTCASAFVVPQPLPFADTGTTVGYANDYDETCPYAGGTAPDVVYAYTPSADTTVNISLCVNSDYDTKLYVYRDSCTSGTAVGCDDDSCPTPSYPLGYVSRITGLSLTAGHTYYIVIDGYGTASGNYTFEIMCDCPGPVPHCSPDSIYARNPELPDDDWNAFASAQTSAFTYIVYEDFSGVMGITCGIHWFGLALHYDSGWSACHPTGMTFSIKFYEDDGGAPGVETCSYTVAPIITDANTLYGGHPLYQFDVPSLSPCCNRWAGWISIQSLQNASDCAFVWLSSATGDGLAYQQDVQTGEMSVLTDDLAICLSGVWLPYGACCDDVASTCVDGVEMINCQPPLRFALGTLCADLDPPCGPTPGACCHPDGTCEIVLQALCTDNWLGPDTACTQCPCIVICPEGSIPEPELCGEDLDGGCDATGYPFAPIAIGDVICGTYYANTSTRDTDWYQIVIDTPKEFTWSVRGTIQTRAFIIDGSAGCPVSGQYWSAAGAECTDVTVIQCVPPGTYWFWAGASSFADYPCEQTYVGTLTAVDCTIPMGACCLGNGSCAPNKTEPGCAALNGIFQGDGTVCDPNPCPPCQVDFVVDAPGVWDGNTCGADNDCTLRASEDQMWQVDIPEAGVWHFELCGASFDTCLYVGTSCCGQEVGYNDDACGTASIVMATIPAGTYYVDVEASSSSACGTYPLNVFMEQPCIPECPEGTTPEGEPPCGPDYEDNWNGGCGLGPEVFQLITAGQTYCGESGTFLFEGEERRDLDWYEITVAEQSVFTFDVQAEFGVVFGMVEQYVPGVPGCDNVTGYVNPHAVAERCTPMSVTSACLEAGTYYFLVAPNTFTGVECGTKYTALLTIEPCVIPTGACCLPSGICVPELTEAECQASGGVWVGPDTDCGEIVCEPFYCAAGSSYCDEYIGNVIVGDISNPSECSAGGYADYTDLCIEMQIGSSYDITIENPVPYGSDQCGVWVDWNRDYVFDTWTERVVMTGSPGGGPYTAAIAPPPDATPGDTTMRIRVMYTGALDPCGVTQYGEVEDYCVTVRPPTCGDLDDNGLVDMGDYFMVLDAFGTCAGSPKFLAAADFDGDGCITLVDYQAWVRCYEDANGGTAFQPPARRPAAPRPAAPPRRNN